MLFEMPKFEWLNALIICNRYRSASAGHIDNLADRAGLQFNVNHRVFTHRHLDVSDFGFLKARSFDGDVVLARKDARNRINALVCGRGFRLDACSDVSRRDRRPGQSCARGISRNAANSARGGLGLGR